MMLSATDGPTPGSVSSSALLAVLMLIFFDFESRELETFAEVVLFVTFSLFVTRCAAGVEKLKATAAINAVIQVKRILPFINIFPVKAPREPTGFKQGAPLMPVRQNARGYCGIGG